jgi:hypothetical protein
MRVHSAIPTSGNSGEKWGTLSSFLMGKKRT